MGRSAKKTAQAKPKIRLLHHMARSGGTVISRCLACMKDVVLLSEIHPLTPRVAGAYARALDPLHQAQRWFDLFTPDEVVELKRRQLAYHKIIRIIYRRVIDRDKILILRDWSHLDFTGAPFVEKPSYRLAHADALCQEFQVLKTATVRHPLTQWLSLDKLPIVHGKLDVSDYLKGYRAFAQHADTIGYSRFEDFTDDAATAMQQICERLEVPFDPEFETAWKSYHKITGDVAKPKLATHEIRRPETTIPTELVEKLESSADCREACRLLHYE